MDMEFLTELNELAITDHQRLTGGRMGRRKLEDDDDNNNSKEFKSKNLQAERRRRQKLSDRLLTLRSLVPIITNAITQHTFLYMNKATIIDDAITYIQELQKTSQVLSEQLLEMEGSSEESVMPMKLEIDVAQHDMKKCGIKEEVKVSNIDGNKFLIKIIVEKKRGCFTQLIRSHELSWV
ncbi:hypothetical protein GOBAR_DD10772 [Gossypium barbadense]|nr:hypothetical protein GOBAR_DD10772 [Gossypium barbadense]